MLRDRLIASLAGSRVVVPVGDDVVRGSVAEVRRGWLVLDDVDSDGMQVDGRMIVALPLPWIQVVGR